MELFPNGNWYRFVRPNQHGCTLLTRTRDEAGPAKCRTVEVGKTYLSCRLINLKDGKNPRPNRAVGSAIK